jgi:hypothetical protein
MLLKWYEMRLIKINEQRLHQRDNSSKQTSNHSPSPERQLIKTNEQPLAFTREATHQNKRATLAFTREATHQNKRATTRLHQRDNSSKQTSNHSPSPERQLMKTNEQ